MNSKKQKRIKQKSNEVAARDPCMHVYCIVGTGMAVRSAKEADDSFGRYSIILLLVFFVNHIYIHVGSLYRDDLRAPRYNILTGKPAHI